MATKKQSDGAKKETAATAKPRVKRQVFAEGHKRKFLVVVDETPECESALAFAASRALRTKGQLALLYVVEPGTDIPHFLGIEEVAREEGLNKARAVFRLFGRKLKAMGFEDVVPEEIVREGMKADEITKLIEEDTDIGVLVLGASKDPSGPGPLVTTLAGGRLAGTFPVPITVVPGCLGLEEILALWREAASAAPLRAFRSETVALAVRRRNLMRRIVLLSAMFICGSLTAAEAAPASIAGSWAGSGTVGYRGSVDKVHCRARFTKTSGQELRRVVGMHDGE